VRKGANLFGIVGAIVALGLPFPIDSLAKDASESEESAVQAGEDRWVPSLAITSGITVQQQKGSADSCLYPGGIGPDSCSTIKPKLCFAPSDRAGKSCSKNSDCDSSDGAGDGTCGDPPLRGFVNGDDLAVSPFVGGSLELMAPALPIPTRPRFFVSGEILPTFASDRDLALEGDPGCVRGPEPGAPCASKEPTDEDDLPLRLRGFTEDQANGVGSKTSAEIDTLAYGANLGAAFPLKAGKRQLRLKPSFGWINYKVEAEGLVVDAACPTNQCTDIVISSISLVIPGVMRETTLTASKSQRFNAIGPGFDVEMDTGRYGPLGVSLFMGGRAYAVLGDRKISFGASKTFTDQVSDPGVDPPVKTDRATAQFEVEVDPWIYRAHVGIRFHWLGSEE
jgi:hypothetical protein